jgi:hypothetical protein
LHAEVELHQNGAFLLNFQYMRYNQFFHNFCEDAKLLPNANYLKDI